MNSSVAEDNHPRLRPLDGSIIEYEGMQYLHLRDPLALSGKTLLVPQPLIPLLGMLDGAHEPKTLRALMAIRYNLRLTIDQIDQFIEALDEALYLDNENFHLRHQALIEEFHHQDARLPASAGQAYPENQDDLRSMLAEFMKDNSNNEPSSQFDAPSIRGIISPHIDYDRGARVYSNVWAQAARSCQSVERIIILGTDHFSEGHPFSLTYLDYSTPLGRLTTDRDLVASVAAILGEEKAFAGELHHRSEHSIELAAIWLQYIMGNRPISFLPILCGPLSSFENADGSPGENHTVNGLVTFLAIAASEEPSWIIAAGDLSHVGPAFGGAKVDTAYLSDLYASDQTVIDYIAHGDAEGFYRHIRRSEDHTNICGTTPIYLALRILGKTNGISHAYSACPADGENTSFVTICGMTLT